MIGWLGCGAVMNMSSSSSVSGGGGLGGGSSPPGRGGLGGAISEEKTKTSLNNRIHLSTYYERELQDSSAQREVDKGLIDTLTSIGTLSQMAVLIHWHANAQEHFSYMQ